LSTQCPILRGIDHGIVREQFVVENEEGPLFGLCGFHLTDDIFREHIGAESIGDIVANFSIMIVDRAPVPFGFLPLEPDLPDTPGIESCAADVIGPGLESGELPLPGYARGIAVLAECPGEGWHFLEVHFLLRPEMDGKDSGVSMMVRDQAGVQADPGGSADRTGVSSREAQAFPSHAIEVWGIEIEPAIRSKRFVADVVRKNEEDVGFFSRFGCESEEGEKESETERTHRRYLSACPSWAIPESGIQ